MSLVLHSAAFVQRWKALVRELYRYEDDGDAMSVPSVLGARTAVYLPLLNYGDRSREQAQALCTHWAGRAYQVRALDPDDQQFEANDTVTMRLDLTGLSTEEVFMQRIHSKCRNQIRKAEKSGLRWVEGCDGELLTHFYQVFASTMHRYGTPVFSRRLFELLPAHVSARYLVAYAGTEPVAGLCMVVDGPLAWVPWAGSEPAHRAKCPNHLLYWNAIQKAVAGGQTVFDFGRSAYLGPTYVFKRDWGARPVKIAVLTDKSHNVYAKYALASSIWQRLPRWLVDLVGPWLCRRLPDL